LFYAALAPDYWQIDLGGGALDNVSSGAALLYHEARHAELAHLSKHDQAVSISVQDNPLMPGSTEYTIARNSIARTSTPT
jgi:hypothetical protein